MRQDFTKSFEYKREPFSTKKTIFNALINILKFPPPENLLTHCKDTLKNFSSVCSFAKELGITAAINQYPFNLMLQF